MVCVGGGRRVLFHLFLLCDKPPKYFVAPNNLLYLSLFRKLSAQLGCSCLGISRVVVAGIAIIWGLD